MTPEQTKAYEEAERRIEAAIEEGAENLRLDFDVNLAALPPQIADCKDLRRLYLKWSRISDLPPLSQLERLRTLNLMATPVANLDAIRDMLELESLNLEATYVTDLTPLNRLSNLNVLVLIGTQVTDLSPLMNHPALHSLYVNRSGIADLRPILTWPSFRGSADGDEPYGELWLEDSAATKTDPTLARITADNKGENARERARRTLAHLATLPLWPEPLPWQKKAAPALQPEKPVAELTSTDLLVAQDDTGWRFSPTHGVLELFARDQPLEDHQERLAKLAADRMATLLAKIGDRNDAGGIRQDVAEEATRFSDILADNDTALSLRALDLWGSLIALGNLLDANDTGRAEGRDPLDLLPTEARAALQTALSLSASLVRSFPEARALDDDLSSFTQNTIPVPVMLALLDKALSAQLVDPKSAALMQHVSDQAEGDGAQNRKAERVSGKGTKNLLLVSALSACFGSAVGTAGGAVVTDIATDISNHYELGEKAIAFLAAAEDDIETFIKGLTPDEQAQLKAALQDARAASMQGQRQPSPPSPEGDDSP
ncbi:MAG: hypothetical protein AAF092_07430 [Pseudomonadota bacterium]